MRSLLLPLVPVVLVLAACGGDDDASSDPGSEGAATPSADAVRVVAQDISFPEDAYEADAGAVEFVYENEGNTLHTLVIEDVGGFELTVRSNGDVDTGSVELEPGEYTLFCDVPGHRPAGMVADLVVR